MPSGDCWNSSLFRSQCSHRIEARCTPRGNDACEGSDRHKRCGNYGVNGWIEWFDPIEQVAHQLAGFEASCESYDQTKERGSHSIEQHRPHHLFALCAQRDADADFGRPLRRDVRHHAEQADRGKNQREKKLDMISHLGNPDVNFAKIAEAYDIKGEVVADPNDLKPALQRAVNATRDGKPYLLDVLVAQAGQGANMNWYPKVSIAEMRSKKA